jgi:hypothetical protein
LLTVGIGEKGDPRGPVRVVFYGLYDGWNAELLALEIHDSIGSLVASAAMAGGDVAMGIAPSRGSEWTEEGFPGTGLRYPVEVRHRPKAKRRGYRSISPNAHGKTSLNAFKKFDF